jgi:hypothetical protein
MSGSLTMCGDAHRNIAKPMFRVSQLITDAIGWFGTSGSSHAARTGSDNDDFLF